MKQLHGARATCQRRIARGSNESRRQRLSAAYERDVSHSIFSRAGHPVLGGRYQALQGPRNPIVYWNDFVNGADHDRN